jgi:hypothetical protein
MLCVLDTDLHALNFEHDPIYVQISACPFDLFELCSDTDLIWKDSSCVQILSCQANLFGKVLVLSSRTVLIWKRIQSMFKTDQLS